MLYPCGLPWEQPDPSAGASREKGLFALRSLAVPSGTKLNLDAVKSSEAVRLFVDRAQIVDGAFVLDAQSAPPVLEICRRLDAGIPLAIELAAARVKILSVEEIRSRLDDRFRLMTGGNKALPRHQTLRAAFQWSYDLLTAEEQRLFRLLAVFAGGWTLEAASAVWSETADEFEVLELMTHLADKSLVIARTAREWEVALPDAGKYLGSSRRKNSTTPARAMRREHAT